LARTAASASEKTSNCWPASSHRSSGCHSTKPVRKGLCLRSNFCGQAVQDRVVHLPGEGQGRFSLIQRRRLRLSRVAKRPRVFGEWRRPAKERLQRHVQRRTGLANLDHVVGLSKRTIMPVTGECAVLTSNLTADYADGQISRRLIPNPIHAAIRLLRLESAQSAQSAVVFVARTRCCPAGEKALQSFLRGLLGVKDMSLLNGGCPVSSNAAARKSSAAFSNQARVAMIRCGSSGMEELAFALDGRRQRGLQMCMAVEAPARPDG